MTSLLPSQKKWDELTLLLKKLSINKEDVEKKVIYGSGKGGQKKNKTATCVQLKHLPSGLTVKSQKTRSLQANLFFAYRQLCQHVAKKNDIMFDKTINKKIKQKQKRQSRSKKKYIS